MIRLTLCKEVLAADGIAIPSPGVASEPASDVADITPIIAKESAP